MINDILTDTEDRMKKSVDTIRQELAAAEENQRTG